LIIARFGTGKILASAASPESKKWIGVRSAPLSGQITTPIFVDEARIAPALLRSEAAPQQLRHKDVVTSVARSMLNQIARSQ
jgi:hypothetical protein